MTLDLVKIDADLGSPDEDTRWQAAIALGAYCEDAPELIWLLTVKWGSCEDEDVREAIAACVLEHILEYHFAVYFPKTAQIIRGGNELFGDTLNGCWWFGQARTPQNVKRLTQFQKNMEKTRRK